MTPLERLRKHVTGKIESGEAIAIVEIPAEHVTQNQPNQQTKKMTTTKTKLTEEDFTRIESDINGNPRYYLPIYLAQESIARKLGAVKYRGKKYGEGWVFQTYSLRNDCDKLNASI